MDIFTYEDWEQYGLVAGYCTDFDGRFRYYSTEDINHYGQVANAFGLTEQQMVRVHQKHTNQILVVHNSDGGEGVIRDTIQCEYDALITDAMDLMLCIVTADCVPVFLFDKEHHAIAMVHSGRAGTMKEIAAETVQKMQASYGTDPKDVLCIFGPYLCAKHHEVRKCDITGFDEQFSSTEQSRFITRKGDRYYVDMGEAIRISLRRVGLTDENIRDDRVCTYEDKALYSWRRDHDADARSLSFLFMREGALRSFA